jgi:hypothetical protein
VLEFPEVGFIYMGSIVSLSYNVYRDKAPVFNCGNTTISGFAIGKKYVAGSIVNIIFTEDEIANFVKEYGVHYSIRNADTLSDFSRKQAADQSLKEIHTFMKDDLTSFNIHCIFTSEYHAEAKRVIIYGATFINNGQVMSIDDIITEGTVSFVAKDIKEQHDLSEEIESIRSKPYAMSGSELAKRRDSQIKYAIDTNFTHNRIARDNPFTS